MKWRLVIPWLLLVAMARAQSASTNFGQKIAVAARVLNCADPDEQHPVTLNAQLISASGSDSVAVIVKVRMALGWHIYAYVPSTMPYIVTECIVKPDPNVKLTGDWEKSKPTPTMMDKGVFIYEKEAVFIHKLVKASAVQPVSLVQGCIIKPAISGSACRLLKKLLN